MASPDGMLPLRVPANSSSRYFRPHWLSVLLSIRFCSPPAACSDFLLAFPWTVTITLGVSLLVAMLFIPFVQYKLIRKGLHANGGTNIRKQKVADFIQEKYNILIQAAFRFPKITVGLAFAAIVAGVLVFLTLPQKMMPITERNQFAVEIYLPQGSPLSATAAVADSLEKILRPDKRITSITKFVGTTSPRFHTCYAPNFPSQSYAQFIVSTNTIQNTEKVLDDYTDKYADYFPMPLSDLNNSIMYLLPRRLK